MNASGYNSRAIVNLFLYISRCRALTALDRILRSSGQISETRGKDIEDLPIDLDVLLAIDDAVSNFYSQFKRTDHSHV